MILARRKLRLLNSQTDLKVAHQNLFPSAKKCFVSFELVKFGGSTKIYGFKDFLGEDSTLKLGLSLNQGSGDRKLTL